VKIRILGDMGFVESYSLPHLEDRILGVNLCGMPRKTGGNSSKEFRALQEMTLFQCNGESTHIPTRARAVADVAGVGDTVVATLSLSLAAASTLARAARLANIAAGIVVIRVGIAVILLEQLRVELGNAKTGDL